MWLSTADPDITAQDMIDSVQVEVGDTVTVFEPYVPVTAYPVTWSSEGTVYGGYVDLITGEVWKTYNRKKISELIADWQDTWGGRFRGSVSDMTKEGNGVLATGLYSETYNPSHNTANDLIICRYQNVLYIKDAQYGNDVEAFISAMGDYYVAYMLASPVPITTLTPQQINAIKGNNTVWSDANGNLEVTYMKKG